jgi:hypothetical protein
MKRYDEIVLAVVSDWVVDAQLTDRVEWMLADGAMRYNVSGNEFAERVKRDVDVLVQRWPPGFWVSLRHPADHYCRRQVAPDRECHRQV